VRCTSCRRVLRSLTETVRSLGSLSQANPPGLADATIAALRAANGSRPARWSGHFSPRVTVPIAFLLGVVLSLVNQGGMLLAGQIDLRMCAICGLNFVLPLLGLNIALLAVGQLAEWRR
jgi:hypothetical protein